MRTLSQAANAAAIFWLMTKEGWRGQPARRMPIRTTPTPVPGLAARTLIRRRLQVARALALIPPMHAAILRKRPGLVAIGPKRRGLCRARVLGRGG